MKKILNQLIQLQELDYALAEQKAVEQGGSLEMLEKAISESLQKLPPEIGERYQRLKPRSKVVVVPIIHGACSSCGIALPAATVHAARTTIEFCPHCNRFLYLEETILHRETKPPVEKAARPAGIARFSAPELMLPQLQGKTAKAVITEMAEHLVAQDYAGDAPALIQLALERETVVSTAVGKGLAFPHVRDIKDGGLTFALGLKPAGVPWEAADGRRTRIIFFLLIPPPARAFYLRLLAGLVTVFSQEDPKESLLKCDTADEMWKVLLKTTMKSIP